MREIVTLQFGQRANYLATHFWNIQESYFTYAPNTEPSIVDHDIHFRAGLGSDGHTETYTPRTIIYDLKGGFGTLKQRNALYDNDSSTKFDQSAWTDHGLTTIKQQPIRPIHYQRDLDAGLPTTQLRSSEVRYWSDFNRVFFHPRSIVQLNEYTLNDTIRPFENWAAGIDLWHDTDKQSAGLLDRDVRLFAEECDSLQGFQVLSGIDDAWGGWCSRYIDALRDEFGKKSMWLWGLQDDAELQREKRIAAKANVARTLCATTDLVSATISLSARGEQLPDYVKLKSTEWHRTGLLATAFESVTIPIRLRQEAGRGSSMAHFEQVLNGDENRSHWELGFKADQSRKIPIIANGFATAPNTAEDEADVDELIPIDVDLTDSVSALLPNTITRSSDKTRHKHVFAQVATHRTSDRISRNTTEYARLDQEVLLRKRYNEEAIVERFHVPLAFPRLDAYPSDLFNLSNTADPDERKINLWAALTTSSSVKTNTFSLRDLVTRHNRVVPLDEREDIYDGLTGVGDHYNYGWDSGSEGEDD